VKRGMLWYLNESLFGKGVGADDPFVRCRTEAGMATLKDDSGKDVWSIATTPNSLPVPRATVPITASPTIGPVVALPVPQATVPITTPLTIRPVVALADEAMSLEENVSPAVDRELVN
jgi:hypothetical protein